MTHFPSWVPASLSPVLIGLLASFVASYLAVTALIRVCLKYRLCLDTPDSRRLHLVAVPRCGGVAVFAATVLTAMGLLWLFPSLLHAKSSLNSDQLRHFLCASTILFFVGLLDDFLGLSWFVKLLGQVAVASLMALAGITATQVLSVNLSPFWDLSLTIAWFVALINAFNLIDGLDGLAAGLAITGALGLMVVAFLGGSPVDILLLSVFIGANLGFLVFNFHPAKIFLGDSGSMFIGFFLATVGLMNTAKTTTLVSVALPLLAMGVPIFDTLLAVWRRSARLALRRSALRSAQNNEKISSAAGVDARLANIVSADLDHIHHRLVRAGLTQRKVAVLLYAASATLVAVGLLATFFGDYAGAILLYAFLAGTYVVARHLARTELWDSGQLIVAGLSRPRGRVLSTIIYPLVDIILLSLGFFISLPFVQAEALQLQRADLLTSQLPIWVGLPFILLVLGGSYSRVWSRARISDFLSLALILMIGTLSAATVTELLSGRDLSNVVRLGLLTGFFDLVLILGLRALPRSLRDLLGVMQTRDFEQARQSPLELIYGAGLRGELYLRLKSAECARNQTVCRALGFIDDDLNLRMRKVHGLPVLGAGIELESLVQRLGIHRVVLACSLPEAVKSKVTATLKNLNVTLIEWCLEERTIFGSRSVAEGYHPAWEEDSYGQVANAVGVRSVTGISLSPSVGLDIKNSGI